MINTSETEWNVRKQLKDDDDFFRVLGNKIKREKMKKKEISHTTVKELATQWAEFKKWRKVKQEENRSTEEYKKAEEAEIDAMERQNINMQQCSIFSIAILEIDAMFVRVAMNTIISIENNNVPPETFEGLMDWINQHE